MTLGRQVAALAIQIEELQATLAEHKRLHEAEAEARVRARRWWLSMAVATVGAVDVPMVMIVLATHGH